jgi:peptidyl-prolyl cis-trans isomerase B (cyclophilin B)
MRRVSSSPVPSRRFETPRQPLDLRLLAVTAAAALALAGCGGDDGGSGEEGSGPTSPPEAAAEECKAVQEPEPRRVRTRAAPRLRLDSSKTYVATVETSCGDFQIELDSQHAPRTGGSFVTLARERFYDGLPFHRIVTGFVIQGGDPRGNGTGGPGYTVREGPPGDVVYSEGVVAMAKSQADPPGTSGSQFFVMTSDNAALEPIYALLGKVTKGLDVVHRIEEIPAGPDEQPVQPVVIERIRIAVE